MALSKRNALIVVMFLVPVICCFVGIGAFVHVILAAESREQQKQVEMRRQRRQELAEMQRQLDFLQKTANALVQKITEIQDRIRELAEKLIQASKDDATAQAIQTEIRGLKERLARLLAELSELQDQIAEKQKHIDELKRETEDAGPLNEQLKTLQEQLAKIREQVDQARSEHKRLAAKADELRRILEEIGREFTIIPSKPLPPGTPKPVFVECTAQGVIIQPAGTKLGADPNADDRNRFLAAAGRSGFVVFLVRPGGFYSFEKYRAIVQNDGSMQFGFEPVDASWNLVYPK